MAEKSDPPPSEGDVSVSKGKKPVIEEKAEDETKKDNAPEADPELDPESATKVQAMLKSLGLSGDIPKGLPGGNTKKDMSSHKFWQTQPVPSFDDAKQKLARKEEGPIKEIEIDKVSKEPPPIPEGFEWVTMDLSKDDEVTEVYELLSEHYVEDDEAMFRFNYSPQFFNWALKAPGWRKEWHVGVRATKSRKLLAFISAIPVSLRVRKNTLAASEVNFLCVHKKLRDKRLAPVLIKEITRRCYIEGVFQAIYTAGIVIPSPISTCRYFHRTLDFEKLHDVGFSPLPPGTTRQRQVLKFKLPTSTLIPNLRPMQRKDVGQVRTLLTRYLTRFDIAQNFSLEEIEHWLLDAEDTEGPDRIVWSYVVENPVTSKITDFISFYRLESTIIKSGAVNKHKLIKAAYLFYYATEAAFDKDPTKLKTRLNELVKDVLILAKKAKFDVVNAVTLLENPLFLEEQKFGPGDGQLHYYLFNYRAAQIPGGIDANNKPDVKKMGGVGIVML